MGNQLRAGQKNVYSKLLKKFKNRREAIGERGDQNPIPEKGSPIPENGSPLSLGFYTPTKLMTYIMSRSSHNILSEMSHTIS